MLIRLQKEIINMRNARVADVFWIAASVISVICAIAVVLSWGTIFLDYLLYYPQYGTIFLIASGLILSKLIYAQRCYKKQIKIEMRIKPNLIHRLLMGLIIVSTAITYPMATAYVPAFQQVYNPSPYDDEIGNQLPLNYQDALYDEIAGAPSAHGSSVILLPNGELFTVWFAGTGEKQPDVAIYGSHCTPEMTGAGGGYNLTWDEPVVVADTIDQSEGNPVLYMCPNGTLVLFYVTLRAEGPLFDNGWGPILKPGWSLAKIKMKFSNDYGYTWSDPVYLRDDWFWMIRDRPLLTGDNHVLLPCYREAMQYQSFFYRNNDPNLNGEWRVTGRLRTPHGCLQPSIVELDSGRILCVMRTVDDRIYRSHSDDGGYTWTRPVTMRFPNPNSHVHITRLRDGRILILCNPHTYSRNTLSLIVGDPTGQFWSEPYWIFYDPGQSFSYPSMVQLPDDSVVFTYSLNKAKIEYGRVNITLINDIDVPS